MTRARSVLLLLATLLGATAAGAQAAPAAGLPRSESLLFVVQSEHGSLVRVPGGGDRFALTLGGLPSHAVWFSDRPARDTGSVRLGRLAGSAWKALGFRADPPNAVVSLSGGRRSADTVALELSRPRYDAGRRTVSFSARLLRRLSAGLAHHAARLDRALPRRFGASALFIDDGWNGATPTSCDEQAQLDLFPAGVQPTAYLPADGQVIAVRGNESIVSLVLFGFGGAIPTTFGIPNVAAPDRLHYQLCAKAPYPLPAGSVGPGSIGGAACTVGSVVLKAQQAVPGGWIPADGRTLPVASAPKLAAALGATFGGDGVASFALPALSAPPGLRWDVCADGDAWRAGGAGDRCMLGRTTLFATAGLPSNWTAADGRTLRILDAVVLFNLIETTFGGDGITTFALPDPPAPVAHTRWATCTTGDYPTT